jgi:transcriptional regulator NrdR family protein
MTAARKPVTELKGLVCPNCGCRHFYVVYTRPRAEKIVRRKECRHCGRRVITVERVLG